MKKILIILFLSVYGYSLETIKPFIITKNINSSISINNKGLFGIVVDGGIYANPFIKQEQKHLIQKSLLNMGVIYASLKLRDEFNNEFKMVLENRSKVMKLIDSLDLVKKILDRAPTTTPDKLAKDTFDTMIDIYIKNCQKMNKKEKGKVCKIVESNTFIWLKDIVFVFWDEYFKKYAEKQLTEMRIKVAVQTVGTIMFATDTALKINKIVADITSTILINSNKKSDIILMINDFNQAYQYCDMNISKLRKIVVKKANDYNYTFDGLDPEESKIKTFLDLFFHYIHLRKTTEFGKFKFLTNSTLLENVDMKVAPKAAKLMLKLIEEYGNGGNFQLNVFYTGKHDSPYSLFARKVPNPLYSMPNDLDNVYISNNGMSNKSNYKAYWNSSVHYDAIIKSKCILDKIDKNPMISFNKTNHKILFDDGTRKELFLHKINVKIKCSYNADQLMLDTDWNTSKEFRDIYIPEALSDIRGKFAEKYIKLLFKQGYISGYNDGLFHGDWNIRNGEFLKIVSLTLQKFNKNSDYKDNQGKIFSKYVKFLKDENIDIDLLLQDRNINDNLEKNTTRGYVAKVISNILIKKKDKQFSTCKKTGYKDWDECSKYLKDKCIIRGF